MTPSQSAVGPEHWPILKASRWFRDTGQVESPNPIQLSYDSGEKAKTQHNRGSHPVQAAGGQSQILCFQAPSSPFLLVRHMWGARLYPKGHLTPHHLCRPGCGGSFTWDTRSPVYPHPELQNPGRWLPSYSLTFETHADVCVYLR